MEIFLLQLGLLVQIQLFLIPNYFELKIISLESWGGGEVLPYMGYIGMCGLRGYGFSAVLVIDRVSILANFGHFGHKWGMVFAL